MRTQSIFHNFNHWGKTDWNLSLMQIFRGKKYIVSLVSSDYCHIAIQKSRNRVMGPVSRYNNQYCRILALLAWSSYFGCFIMETLWTHRIGEMFIQLLFLTYSLLPEAKNSNENIICEKKWWLVLKHPICHFLPPKKWIFLSFLGGMWANFQNQGKNFLIAGSY